MSGSKNTKSHLYHLIDSFVEDILSASDKEILVEATEDYGDPRRVAGEMRILFENVRIRNSRPKPSLKQIGNTVMGFKNRTRYVVISYAGYSQETDDEIRRWIRTIAPNAEFTGSGFSLVSKERDLVVRNLSQQEINQTLASVPSPWKAKEW